MSGTKPRRFKDAIYRQLARVGKAVASPRRLELLDLLAQGPQTVERLARETGQSGAKTSQHLQPLRRAPPGGGPTPDPQGLAGGSRGARSRRSGRAGRPSAAG